MKLTFMATQELDGMNEASMEGGGPPHPRGSYAPFARKPGEKPPSGQADQGTWTTGASC